MLLHISINLNMFGIEKYYWKSEEKYKKNITLIEKLVIKFLSLISRFN